MTYSVWQTSVGLWRSLCYQCGFSGQYKREDDARQSEHSHLCTYPDNRELV
jgi:hypothetical protein